MKFRTDISFLRAIAVIAVILYHYKFPFFQGGFIGVDIFFVISGYLMTRIILTGFSKDNFNLFDFYKKRVLRIFPALLIMITFIAFLIYFLIPTQFISYMKSFFSSSLFFSNIYYYLNSGYFDSISQFNFLLHTWTLSVEWQFYMIYPLVLMLFRKTFIKNIVRFRLCFFLLIALSIISMLIHSHYDKSYSFYMFYPRAWEMMFGGIAFLFENHARNIKKKTKLILVSICLLFIGVFILKTNERSVTWPSLITVIPVALTTVIILLNINIKLFSSKIVKYIGDISYSLYLWHWPFYVISLFFAVDRLRYRIIFIILSVIFSVLSYHLIEKKNYNNRYKLVLGSSIALFIISFSITKLDAKYIFNNYKSNLAFAVSDYKYSENAYQQYSLENRHLSHYQKFSDYNLDNLKVDENKINIILLGDSHAGMFSQTMNNIFSNQKYNLIQVTADAAFPMINSETNYIGSKDYFNYFLKIYFPKNHKNIDLVIINSNYVAYHKEALSNKLRFTEDYFKKYNTDVLYIGQTDCYSIDFPTYFYMNKHYNINYGYNSILQKKIIDINDYLNQELGEKYINLLNEDIKRVSEGEPYIYDTNHLTYYGTEQYRKFINLKTEAHLKK